ncbi:hypothetical protein [Rhizobium oryzicola]|uniref:DUF945 family protein n=1 Tax=Rhizobium oryzicola TaxID=1232668 RepID=A0ABT8STJ8_9HYPH|nr:hypothetical protein [Rhizobium oryzicola]MDO1581755.1 hypothetical protein [Rhizobium oryzicola]
MTLFRSTRLLLAGAALAALATPAFALDGTDLVNKITAAMALEPGNIAVASVDVTGSTVTLKGMSVGDNKGGERLKVGDVKLQGVVALDNGSYTIEKAVFPDVNVTEEKSTFQISDMYLSGVIIPADTKAGTIDSLLFYQKAHSGPIRVTVEGKEVMSVTESTATTERAEDDSGLNFDVAVNGVKADLSSVNDAQAKETIDSLGLTQIDGTITMKGSWEIEPGTIDLEEYAFDFKNVGRLNLALSLSGYTLDFIKSVQETARATENTADPEAAKQAAGLAMLGLLQQLTFNSAEISFEDQGITKRGLDYAGKKQNVSGKQMAMMVKGMAPLMLAQLNMPKLQNSVSAAINTFIDNPRSLTISAEPQNPIPLPMLIGAAQAAPNTLPDMLGLTVSANE